MAARLPPGCDPPPGRDPPPGDDDDFEEPKYLAKRKTQQAKNNNKRKAQEEPAASAAAKPRNKATKTSKATKKAVKPFWNRLTEAWSKLMPDCAESSCMPGDEPKVKVWCDVRATKIKALPPLEQPLHATLTAACKLQTNAAAHRAAWEAEQQKKAELKAAAAAKKKKKQQQQPDDDDDDDDDDNNNDDNDDNGGGGQPPVYPGPVRSVKCRVQLTKLQLAKVKLWNAGTRATYNSMAAHCNEHGLNISKKELRALFVNDAVLTGNSAWLKDIPYDVRDRATQDIKRAIKGFFTRLKNWKEKCDELRQASVREEDLPKKPTCRFKFRSHRDDQCLEIRHRDWNRPYQHEQRNAKARDAGKKERSYHPSIYDDVFTPEVLACKRMPDGLPKTMAADFKLICDRRKRWFISMPQPAKQADMDTAPNNLHGVVALDPGARCFNTCFSSDGQIIEFGCLPKRPHLTKSERRRQRQQEREELDRLSPEERAAQLAAKKRQSLTSIVSLCHIADQKASQHDRVKFVKPERPLSMSKKEWTKALCKERRRVKRTKAKLHERYLAILERIRNKTREVHNKLALFLCRNFRVILIPTFNMHDMIKRGERKLHKKTVRALAGWSHGYFRKTLQAKAELFPWVTIELCDEHHTSKTCSSCGEIHEKLGGKKTFVCPSCGYRADRDCSAARNILLRYLTVNAVPSPCNMATPLLTPR